jgi:polar amino acid transport system substrate-binding protein
MLCNIVIGTDATYAPNEFTAPDCTTIIGMDVDLGNAVAEKLGWSALLGNPREGRTKTFLSKVL